MNRFIQIDEQGQFHFQGLVVSDTAIVRELFESMRYDEKERLLVSHDSVDAFVEAYDSPLMVCDVDIENQNLILPSGFMEPFDIEELKVDEWGPVLWFSVKEAFLLSF